MIGVARWIAASAALVIANLGGMIVMIMDAGPSNGFIVETIVISWFVAWGFVVALVTPRLWQTGVLAGASGLYLAFYALTIVGPVAAIWDLARSLGGALIGAILYQELAERLS